MTHLFKKKELFLFLFALSAIAMLSTIQPTVDLTLKDSGEENRETENRGREEYFFDLMRNPFTNEIPRGIRAQEVKFAESIPTTNDFQYKSSAQFEFTEVGPSNVGGRTRALAVDVRNSNIIIAGGVSGGIWKSTDGGQSWTRRTRDDQLPMVSFVAQDTRPGHQDTWYYTTGERNGNSASDRGFQAVYGGHGIYRSIDNGDSWELLNGTTSTVTGFDSCFDYGIKVEVSPTTGTVFVATAVCGVFRSADGITWNDFSPDLGGVNEHAFSDVEVASDGTVYAVLSSTALSSDPQTNAPGIYESTDDGLTWTDITPTEMPSFHDRTRLAVSPSDPDILYAFIEGSNSNPNLLYIDRDNPANNELRTSNIPDYSGEDPEPAGPGNMNLQGGYNMALGINPSNGNQVIIGGTNLFRSSNGFSSAPEISSGWIGGYGPNDFLYPNHHPDQHIMFFDPNNPNRLFTGHDGGISVTENINASSISWTDLNNDYNVTQFYTVAVAPIEGDNRIVGGTQDNGSPYFRFDTQNGTQPSEDVSSGDGSYAALRFSSGFVSSQRGNIFRLFYQPDTEDLFSPFTTSGRWTRVQPAGASGQLFIHPYLVDYLFESVMYYPSEDELYRNSNLNAIPDFDGGAATEGWAVIPDFSVNNFPLVEDRSITAMDISRASPSGVLYVAGSDRSGTRDLKPTIKKIVNAFSNNVSTDVSIEDLPEGAYIHDITVNPVDGNELLVAASNYGLPNGGIYHSDDGGITWTAVRGNLNFNSEGPSIRSTAIAEIDDETTVYFIGTSVGLYSTQLLDGENTEWVRESPAGIGLHVVEYLDYRPQDNTLAVATHGRGLFIGQPQGSVSNEDLTSAELPQDYALQQNYPNPFNPSTNISFELPQSSQVTLSVYDVNGRLVAELLNSEFYAGGWHEISFDASNLASGVYLYNLRAVSAGGRSFTQTRSMTLIK
jgi:hypothetical protein